MTTTIYEMTGAIYFASGMGHRECSADYEAAYEARQAARDALAACDELSPGYLDLADDAQAAQGLLNALQAEGGHIGKLVPYDTYDATAAQMAGGRVRILQAA